MFEGCYSLKRLNGIGSWNMSNCKDISRILYECTEIKPVENIGGWNISSKCTNMERAFYQLHFNMLNITGWNTSKVKNMEGVFYNLVPVDANGNLAPNTGILSISGFDFTSCQYFFQNWITGSRYRTVSIRNIKLPNTTSLESFIRCPGATSYNFSNWDFSNIPTGKMISFKGLFGQCLNATSFNFSNWNLREDFGFSWTTEDPALVTDCPWARVTTTGCNTVTINKIKTFDPDWRNA
jgi:surface protein